MDLLAGRRGFHKVGSGFAGRSEASLEFALDTSPAETLKRRLNTLLEGAFATY